MLEHLHLQNVGPARSMVMELAPRLNLMTGDNGLGKSFLLDVAWWALTRRWPQELNANLTSGYRALPRDVKKPATITLRIQSRTKAIAYTSTYSARDERWIGKAGRPANPGLVIYAHSDGGFSVWDPARNYWRTRGKEDVQETVPAYVFSPHEVWYGRTIDFGGKSTLLCRGLIDDWAIWIRENGQYARAMAGTLDLLAPRDEHIEVGPLLRLSVNDTRDYPSIRTPYSDAVRIVHASAGMRRIMGLAYMLMWSWLEHVRSADLQGLTRTNQVTMLFDEIESHLHPRWQRSILQSLLSVAEGMHHGAKLQLVAATHSPLVLASAEPFFDEAKDAWFDLDLDRQSGVVELRHRAFVRHGDVSNWLTSEAFDLKEARSREAEEAIERARALLRSKRPALARARTIDDELRKAGLPDIDPFWVRWSAFVDKLAGQS
jgi:putative AbiEii toxin of type IV toxin-antitoxin system